MKTMSLEEAEKEFGAAAIASQSDRSMAAEEPNRIEATLETLRLLLARFDKIEPHHWRDNTGAEVIVTDLVNIARWMARTDHTAITIREVLLRLERGVETAEMAQISERTAKSLRISEAINMLRAEGYTVRLATALDAKDE